MLDDAGATVVAATAVDGSRRDDVSLAGVDAARQAEAARQAGPGQRERPGLAADRVAEGRLHGAGPRRHADPTPSAARRLRPRPGADARRRRRRRSSSGKTGTVSGTLTQAAAGLVGQAVTVFAQPRGAAAPVAVGTATTDAAGAWTLGVKPKKQTAYTAALRRRRRARRRDRGVKHRLRSRSRSAGARRRSRARSARSTSGAP